MPVQVVSENESEPAPLVTVIELRDRRAPRLVGPHVLEDERGRYMEVRRKRALSLNGDLVRTIRLVGAPHEWWAAAERRRELWLGDRDHASPADLTESAAGRS